MLYNGGRGTGKAGNGKGRKQLNEDSRLPFPAFVGSECNAVKRSYRERVNSLFAVWAVGWIKKAYALECTSTGSVGGTLQSMGFCADSKWAAKERAKAERNGMERERGILYVVL